MELKAELELLRGRPIDVVENFEDDSGCNETSDATQLCKHPVVSVQMVTYNHEKFVRQALDGVLSQQTDFEFEVVIGEDVSTDSTRAICFEYQRKFPDKMRVLWSEKNVGSARNHVRVSNHCRGEFIAFCDGDDFWTDPLKLSRQVVAMREHPSAALCFCGSKILSQESGKMRDYDCSAFRPGLIPGKEFFWLFMLGRDISGTVGNEGFIMTSTALVRAESFRQMRAKYEIFKWRLTLSDTIRWIGMSQVGDVVYLPEQVSTYRVHQSGALTTNGWKVAVDATIVRLWWSIQVFGGTVNEWMTAYINLLVHNLRGNFSLKPMKMQREAAKALWRVKFVRHHLLRPDVLFTYLVARLGLMNRYVMFVIGKPLKALRSQRRLEFLRPFYVKTFGKEP